MIDRPSQYFHVKGVDVDENHPLGDLNRMTINGDIMPMRDKPYGVRGEDIAFLLEASAERLAAYNRYDPEVPYTRYLSREITFSNPKTVRDNIVNDLVGTKSKWFKQKPTSPGSIPSIALDDVDLKASLADYYPLKVFTQEDIESSGFDFKRLDKLDGRKIESLFNDLGKFVYWEDRRPKNPFVAFGPGDYYMRGTVEHGYQHDPSGAMMEYMRVYNRVLEDGKWVWKNPVRNKAILKEKTLHWDGFSAFDKKGVELWAVFCGYDSRIGETDWPSNTLEYRVLSRIVDGETDMHGDYRSVRFRERENYLFEVGARKFSSLKHRPFTIIESSMYGPTEGGYHQQHLGVRVERVFGIHELRDRTRWQ